MSDFLCDAFWVESGIKQNETGNETIPADADADEALSDG
jgi:hypothetical protein